MNDIQKWCRIGYYIDARDNMNEWCIAEVKDLTKTSIKIIMHDWAPKWEVTLPIKSPKIAPFRRMSKGSTVPKLRCYKSQEFSLVSLQNVHEKLTQALQGGLFLEDAFQTTQFFRGKFFLFCDSLLACRASAEHVRFVLNYSVDVIKLVLKWLSKSRVLFPCIYQCQLQPDLYLEDNASALACSWYELTEIFKKFLGIDSKIGDIFTYLELPPEYSRGMCSGENRSKWTKFFLDFFISEKGFDLLIEIAQNEDEKSRVPFSFLIYFPVYEMLERLDPQKTQNISTSFSRAVLKRIEIVSDTELKDLKHEEIILLLNRLKRFRVFDGKLNIEQQKISFFLKMLKSGYLEKRIKGLTEINSAIDGLEEKWVNDHLKYKQSTEDVKNWLYRSDILKTLLTDRPHIELIKRSNTVLKFYARCHLLDNTELSQLWDSVQGKHESYVRATFDVIVDLSSVLNEQQNDFLFGLMKKVEEYEECFIAMVREFSIKAITTAKKSMNCNTQSKLYGVEMFREILMSNASFYLSRVVIKSLVGIVAEDISHQTKTECLKIAKVMIKNKGLTFQGIILFLKITKRCYRCASDPNEYTLIKKILGLGEFVIKDLQDYLGKSQDEELDLRKKVIYYYLRFLGYRNDRGPDNPNQSYFERLWSMFTGKGDTERSIFFNWLHRTVENKSSQNSQILYVFRSFFLNDEKFPVKCCSTVEYESFIFYFLEFNKQRGNIEMTETKNIKFRRNKKVKGLNKLVNICIYTEDQQVFEKSARMVFALVSRFDSYTLSDASEIVNELIENLMNLISSHLEDEEVVERTLMLICILIDRVEDELDYNSTVYLRKGNKEYIPVKINQFKTIRHIRKEISKHLGISLEVISFTVNEQKYTVSEDDIVISKLRIPYLELSFIPKHAITEFIPYKAISENQRLIDLLFELVSDTNKKFTDLAWKLLLSLPTCKSLKNSLTQLKSPVKELLHSSSTYKLLYSLKVIIKKAKDPAWVESFKLAGGIEFIMSVFTVKEKSIPLKLRAVKDFMILQVLVSVLDCITDSLIFLDSLFKAFKLIAKSVKKNAKVDPENQFFESLNKMIFLTSSSDPKCFSVYLKNNSINKLIQYSLIDSPGPSFVVFSFKVFKKIRKIDDCLEVLFGQVYSLLDTALIRASQSSGYWDLLSVLIRDSRNVEVTSGIVPVLFNHLKNHSSEVSSSAKDEILSGVLKVLKFAIEKAPDQITEGFFSYVLHCLCDYPDSHNLADIPKCKHPDTRNNGFVLLLSLCQLKPNLLPLLNTLSFFHEDPSWRSSKRSGWVHSPITKEKSQTGFVGLKNLGCTCYMNSILQQLFMIRSFRQSILACQTTPNSENLLYQLQFIFAGLQASDKQYISPKNFAKAFKDPDGNEINVIEQMDADEFFASFMDKLETLLKGGRFEDLVKSHFGGIQVTELIGKECPHRSEREEAFLSISVEVKNKKTLIEGLESYVAEELLEGENSYQCDHCESKVRAIRRVCVKYLPNYLILALRRFEFDFDSMSREKLNDFFEFPFELNMEGFTQEGLEKEKVKIKDYYLYRLKGIVIHTGTAESGHYYSYIYDEGNWIEFNDVWVDLVNPSNIPNECFGGEEKFHSLNRSGYREKPGNAYMLIYERKCKYKRSEAEEGFEGIDLECKEKTTEIKEIKTQNKKFWLNKITFGQEYIQFFVKLAKIPELETKFLIKFFLTVLIRSKDKKSELFEVYERIESDLRVQKDLSIWLLDLVTYPKTCRELLIYNPVFHMRKLVVGLCIEAAKHLDGSTCPVILVNLLQNLRLAKRKNTQYYSQYLELVKHIVLALETDHQKTQLISLLSSYILNKPFDLPEPAEHLNPDIYLGYDKYSEENIKEENFYSDSFNACYSHVFHLLYSLRHLIPESLLATLRSQETVIYLISESDTKQSFIYFSKLLSFLTKDNLQMSIDLLKLLFDCSVSSDNVYKSKIFSIVLYYLLSSSDFIEEKTFFLLAKLQGFIKNIRQLSDLDIYISFLNVLADKIPDFSNFLSQKPEILFTIENTIAPYLNLPRPNSVISEGSVKTTAKNMLGRVNTLRKHPVCNIEELEINKGTEVAFHDGYSLIEGTVKSQAGSLILIHIPQNNSFEIKDTQVEEVFPKSK